MNQKEKLTKLEEEMSEFQMWLIQVNDTLAGVRDGLNDIYKLLKGDLPPEELLAPDLKTPEEVSRLLEERRKQREEEMPYLRRAKGPSPVE